MDSSNILSGVVSVIYYIIAGLLTLFSIFAVYILLRYGKNRLFSLMIGALYSVFFLTILAQSFGILQSLRQ